jgi:hypothetical protein
MSPELKRTLRLFLLASIYALGALGIVACGGGGDGSIGDNSTTLTTKTECVYGSSTLGDCKI